MANPIYACAPGALACFLLAASGASAQGLIRDTEIERTLRDWTDPILEVAGLRPMMSTSTSSMTRR